MLNRIYDWIDDRIDITPIWRDVADHEVPEHVNPAYHFSAFVYCFGGLTFFITVIQILSGMFLTMYYVPDIICLLPAAGCSSRCYRQRYAPLGCKFSSSYDVLTYSQSILYRRL